MIFLLTLIKMKLITDIFIKVHAFWIAGLSWWRRYAYVYHYNDVGEFWWSLFAYCCKSEENALNVMNWLRHISEELQTGEMLIVSNSVQRIWERHVDGKSAVMPLKDAEELIALQLVFKLEEGIV